MNVAIALALSLFPTPDPNPVPDGFFARLGDSRFRHGGSFMDLAFSPDGSRVAVAGSGPPLSLWDTHTGRQLWRVQPREAGLWGEVRFSPDGRWVGVSNLITDEGQTRIWDVRTGKELIGPQKGWNGQYLAFSPNGRQVALAEEERIVLREFPGGALLSELKTKNGTSGELAFSPDGQHLVNAFSQGARVWNLRKQFPPKHLEFTGLQVRDPDFTRDGQHVVGLCGSFVMSWDITTGKATKLATTQQYYGFHHAPMANVFATYGRSGPVRISRR